MTYTCGLHGDAVTAGCPGCANMVLDRVEERDLYRTIRSRLRWWKIPNLCSRMGHFWREVAAEPGVMRCCLCRSILFTERSSDESLFRVLGGHKSTCAYWSSNPPNCTCGGYHNA